MLACQATYHKGKDRGASASEAVDLCSSEDEERQQEGGERGGGAALKAEVKPETLPPSLPAGAPKEEDEQLYNGVQDDDGSVIVPKMEAPGTSASAALDVTDEPSPPPAPPPPPHQAQQHRRQERPPPSLPAQHSTSSHLKRGAHGQGGAHARSAAAAQAYDDVLEVAAPLALVAQSPRKRARSLPPPPVPLPLSPPPPPGVVRVLVPAPGRESAGFELQLLEEGHPEAVDARTLFYGRAEGLRARVAAVFRLAGPGPERVAREFEARTRELRARGAAAAAVSKRMFHGTTSSCRAGLGGGGANPHAECACGACVTCSIAAKGFKVDVAGAGLYGRGQYYSEFSSKAMQYTGTPIAEAAITAAVEGDAPDAYRRPPRCDAAAAAAAHARAGGGAGLPPHRAAMMFVVDVTVAMGAAAAAVNACSVGMSAAGAPAPHVVCATRDRTGQVGESRAPRPSRLDRRGAQGPLARHADQDPDVAATRRLQEVCVFQDGLSAPRYLLALV